jgi:hypothetical protein
MEQAVLGILDGPGSDQSKVDCARIFCLSSRMFDLSRRRCRDQQACLVSKPV